MVLARRRRRGVVEHASDAMRHGLDTSIPGHAGGFVLTTLPGVDGVMLGPPYGRKAPREPRVPV
jgi:hypothetical protein